MVKIDFSRVFDSNSFENFVRDFLNCKYSKEQIYYSTTEGKDNGIDSYLNRYFSNGQVKYDQIVQIKWFDQKTKPGIAEFRKKITKTLLDENENYRFNRFSPKKVWFVFSGDILETQIEKLGIEINGILQKLVNKGIDIIPEYIILTKSNIITDMVNEPAKYKNLNDKYNIGLFTLERGDLNEGQSESINDIQKENKYEVLKDIFEDLNVELAMDKILHYYNSHVTFSNFYLKYISSNYLTDDKKRLMKDISDDAKSNKVRESGYHSQKYKFFEQTSNKNLEAIDSIKDLRVYRQEVREGIYVSLSSDDTELLFGCKKFNWDIKL